MMNIKQALLFLLILLFLVALGWTGYTFIQKLTDKELEKLARESRSVGEAGLTLEKREFEISGQKKTTQEAKFYLVSSLKETQVGESFNLEIWINGQNEIVDGAEFLLQFDPNLVKIGEPQPGSFFNLYPLKKVDNELGEVRVIAIQDADKSQKLGEEIVIELGVKALQKGQVSFDFDLGKTHIACCAGQELLKEALPLTIDIK